MVSLHDKRGRGSARPVLLVLIAMTCTAIAGYYCGRASVYASQRSLTTQEIPKKSRSSSAAAKKTCSEQLSTWQKQQWDAALQQQRLWVACPDHTWLGVLADGWKQGDFVIFDVGCNKGYETAEFIQVFAPQLKLTNQQLFIELNRNTATLKLPSRGLCGACLDCQKRPSKQPTQPDPSNRQYLRLHSFEPSDANFKLLSSVQHTLVPARTHEKVELSLYHLAMSDKPGIAEFPTECGEHCNLKMQQHHKTIPVNVSTVDHHVQAHSIPFVDVLKINTQGSDPSVLDGAKSVLSRQKVGAVLFEHHALGTWKDTSLESVVKKMQGFGYVCYYGGQPTLTRLTGCWHEVYNAKRWSHVVCILGGHPKFKEVDALSFIAKPSAPLR